MTEIREHIAYMDEMGNPDECIEECPGCHWEGNRSCEALASGCDICDPDAVYAYAPENAEKLAKLRSLADDLDARARDCAVTADPLPVDSPRRAALLGRILGLKAAAQHIRVVAR